MLLYVRTIADGEPRTATSTLTQLLRSVVALFSSSMLLYVHRDRTDYLGREPRTTTSTFTQLLSSATDDQKCPFNLKRVAAAAFADTRIEKRGGAKRSK